jgi:hypothetical protein
MAGQTHLAVPLSSLRRRALLLNIARDSSPTAHRLPLGGIGGLAVADRRVGQSGWCHYLLYTDCGCAAQTAREFIQHGAVRRNRGVEA